MITAAFLFVRLAQRAHDVPLAQFLGAVLLTQLSIGLHNSWADRELDAVAKPWRAIPRGALAPHAALVAAVALGALGVTLAFAAGPLVGGLVTLGTACGYAYSAWLKRTAFSWLPFAFALPTLAVAALAVAGALDDVPYVVYVVGLPLVLAVHLADQVGDIERDRASGVRGVAVRLGTRRTLIAIGAALATSLALALLLWPAGSPGAGALASAAFGVAALGVAPRSLPLHRVLVLASAVALSADYVGALARA